MDVGLPDMSGLEVTKKIRLQEWNKEKPVPIIALTAHVDGDDKQLCIDAGMNAVLSKPLAKETAGDMLNAFIPQRAKKLAGISSAKKITSEDKVDLLNISGAVIDFEAALKLAGGNKDFVDEMIMMLVNSFDEESKKLEKAHNENNWLEIRAIAHKIKGGASYCGAVRLKDASARLESYLRLDDRKLAEPLYKQMLNEMGLLKQQL
jgi:CheY-like chemotaxis protein